MSRERIGCALLLALILGASPTASAADTADPLTTAWTHYTADLDRARQTLADSEYFRGDTIRAEAYRYLAGLVSFDNGKFLYFGNAEFPVFQQTATAQSDFAFSNPDTFYLTAQISDRYAYRITGRLGTVNQTTIGTYAFSEKLDQTLNKTLAGERATNKTLKTDKNGNFQLIVSKEKMPGQNWLPMIDGANAIAIYQIYADWDKEKKGWFHIEKLGGAGEVPPVDSEASVAQNLEKAGAQVNDTVAFWLAQTKGLYSIPANTVTTPRIIQVSSLGSYFAPGHYNVPPDKALIVEFPAPAGAGYWGWTLYNPWGQMLDFTHRQTSLNANQATVSKDGKYRIVLSAQDPGTPNWLDTAGHPEGAINWRVTTDIAPAAPTMKLVPLADLGQNLPADMPILSAEQRKAALAKRQRAMAERFTN